jgi:type IV pilus assembly protein PilO
MMRRDLVAAIWRQNRSVPLLLAALLILDILLLLLLTLVVRPQEETSRVALVKLQERVRHGGLGDPASRFRQGQADLQRFRATIPPRQEFSELISDLYGLATKAGLSVDQVNYNPKILPQEGLLSYSLAFGVSGRYDQIKRFIHGLEQSSRLVVIDNISLSAANRPDKGQQVALQLALTTYFVNEEAP